MKILNLRKKIAKIDKENVLGSVEALPDQCLHAWEEASKVKVPDSYQSVNKVVMCGMGGSGLAARIIESVYTEDLKVPLIRINSYNLPRFVDQNTLVICSSYSGETEETLANARQAIDARAKWMAIGTGNTLIKMAQDQGRPFYQIKPKYNPSNQPRMAIGYSLVGQLVLAAKAGLIDFRLTDLQKAVQAMQKVQKNQAKSLNLAQKMRNKIIVFISSEHLIGATHVSNNQLNENAKVFSADFQIPELNHHLMEGLSRPEINKSALLTVLINSSLYSQRIQKRLSLTQEVIRKNGLDLVRIEPQAKTKLSQVFEMIQFGALTVFYLAMLYGQNPAPIPWVDYFKTRLGQPLGK